MIENRLRLEREIFKGRRAVRRLMMSSNREPFTPADLDAGHLPDLSMGASLTPDISGDGASWPMDTDVDVPVRIAGRSGRLHLPALGGRRLDRSEIRTSGTATPVELQGSADPLRSVTRRKAWTSKLLSTSGETPAPVSEERNGRPKEDYGLGTPDPVPQEEPGVEATSSAMSPSKQRFMSFPHLPTGMFRHVKDGTLGRLASPFSLKSSNGKETPEATDMVDSNWSSDSSELDEELDVPEGDFRESPFAGPTMSSSREMYVVLLDWWMPRL